MSLFHGTVGTRSDRGERMDWPFSVNGNSFQHPQNIVSFNGRRFEGRALIADDSPSFRRMLRQMLEAHGVEVVGEADNGLDAIQLALDENPDVIFMDINMDSMDGIEATGKIKGVMPSVKVVSMTNLPKPSLVVEAIKKGASNFIIKPFTPTALAGVLGKLLPAKAER